MKTFLRIALILGVGGLLVSALSGASRKASAKQQKENLEEIEAEIKLLQEKQRLEELRSPLHRNPNLPN